MFGLPVFRSSNRLGCNGPSQFTAECYQHSQLHQSGRHALVALAKAGKHGGRLYDSASKKKIQYSQVEGWSPLVKKKHRRGGKAAFRSEVTRMLQAMPAGSIEKKEVHLLRDAAEITLQNQNRTVHDEKIYRTRVRLTRAAQYYKHFGTAKGRFLTPWQYQPRVKPPKLQKQAKLNRALDKADSVAGVAKLVYSFNEEGIQMESTALQIAVSTCARIYLKMKQVSLHASAESEKENAIKLLVQYVLPQIQENIDDLTLHDCAEVAFGLDQLNVNNDILSIYYPILQLRAAQKLAEQLDMSNKDVMSLLYSFSRHMDVVPLDPQIAVALLDRFASLLPAANPRQVWMGVVAGSLLADVVSPHPEMLSAIYAKVYKNFDDMKVTKLGLILQKLALFQNIFEAPLELLQRFEDQLEEQLGKIETPDALSSLLHSTACFPEDVYQFKERILCRLAAKTIPLVPLMGQEDYGVVLRALAHGKDCIYVDVAHQQLLEGQPRIRGWELSGQQQADLQTLLAGQ